MTVRDIYILGAALIGDRENDDKDEKFFTPHYMNILLQEALDVENTLRDRDGQEQLTAAPIVTDMADEVPYHDVLCRAAFPYGLVWLFHQEEENHGLASQYRNMFVEAVERNRCFRVRKYR